MGEKYLLKSRIFRKLTNCEDFSKISPHFKKMANSLRHVFQIYSETCMIFLRDTVHRFLEAEAKSRGEIFQTIFDAVYL